MAKDFHTLETTTQKEFLKDTHFIFDVLSDEHDRRAWSGKNGQNDMNVPVYLRKVIDYTDNLNPIWTDDMIQSGIDILSSAKENNNNLNPTVYPNATHDLLYAINDYSINNKHCLTLGSISPWIESLLLYAGGIVDVYDYNPPILDPNTRFNIHKINKLEKQYDAIVTFSSLEHSGLGRYGDPIDPLADISQMSKLKEVLKPNGLIYLSVPLGKHNELVWNHHRIYGPTRLNKLIDGFTLLNVYGRHGKNLSDYYFGSNNWQNQPVLVLQKL